MKKEKIIAFHEFNYLHYTEMLDNCGCIDEDHIQWVKKQAEYHFLRWAAMTEGDNSFLTAAGIATN